MFGFVNKFETGIEIYIFAEKSVFCNFFLSTFAFYIVLISILLWLFHLSFIFSAFQSRIIYSTGI